MTTRPSRTRQRRSRSSAPAVRGWPPGSPRDRRRRGRRRTPRRSRQPSRSSGRKWSGCSWSLSSLHPVGRGRPADRRWAGIRVASSYDSRGRADAAEPSQRGTSGAVPLEPLRCAVVGPWQAARSVTADAARCLGVQRGGDDRSADGSRRDLGRHARCAGGRTEVSVHRVDGGVRRVVRGRRHRRGSARRSVDRHARRRVVRRRGGTRVRTASLGPPRACSSFWRPTWRSQGATSWWPDVLFPVLLSAGPWVLGLVVQLAFRREDMAMAYARQVEATLEEFAGRAAAGERLRIARELHDEVAHSISALSLQARCSAADWLPVGGSTRATCRESSRPPSRR